MGSPKSKSSLDVSDRGLLEHMPTVSFVCENDEFYTMRNLSASVLRMFGYRPEEFIDNKRIFAASVVFPADLDLIDEQAEAAFSSNSPVTSRVRLVRSDGSVFPALIMSRALFDAKTGKPNGFSGSVVDISELPALHGASAILTAAKQTP